MNRWRARARYLLRTDPSEWEPEVIRWLDESGDAAEDAERDRARDDRAGSEVVRLLGRLCAALEGSVGGCRNDDVPRPCEYGFHRTRCDVCGECQCWHGPGRDHAYTLGFETS